MLVRPAFTLLWLAAVAAAIPPTVRLDSLSVRHWAGAAGLPEETFAALLAPPGGFLWIASNNGLLRFDGRRAELFRPSLYFPGEAERPCASNAFGNLAYLGGAGFWASTQSGCLVHIEPDRFGTYANFRFRAMEAAGLKPDAGAVVGLFRGKVSRRGAFVNWPSLSGTRPDRAQIETYQEVPLLRPPPGLQIMASSATSAGETLATLSDRQVYRHSPESGWQALFRLPGAVRRLLVTRDGSNVYASSTQGLYRWREGSLSQLEEKEVGALLEDSHGCIWIGGWRKLIRRCGESREELSLGEVQEEIHSTLAEDDQGRIWVGGRWGNLFRLSASPFSVYTRKNGMPGSHFTAVAAGSDGAIWAGLRSEGIVRIGLRGEIEQFAKPELLEPQALLPNGPSSMIAATVAGLFEIEGQRVLRLHAQPEITNPGIPALFRISDSELLYSHMQGNFRLRKYGPTWKSEGLAGPPRIRQWARTQDGRVWALGQYEGLVELRGDRYVSIPEARERRSRTWHAIYADEEDLLWLGNAEGLHVYSPSRQAFLGKGPLLTGDHVFQVLPDRFGVLWCATRQGLIRLNRKHALEVLRQPGMQLLAERFGEDQALPTTNFGLATSSGGAIGQDGRLWFPGLLGLVSLEPADFAAQTRPPIGLLSGLEIDGVSADLNSVDRIPPSRQKLSFAFQTIRQDVMGGEFCRFRMLGFDLDWRSCTEARQADYTNLRPGDYRFQLQTSSTPGEWNGQVLELPLELEAAWHQRADVQALGLILLLGSAASLGLQRRRLAQQRTRELECRVEERTRELEAAMQAAQAASRAKGEFLATMSHEIRTPMNGVLGAAQILADSSLAPDQKKLVDVIQQSGESLVAIVDDVLNLAKVEAGKLSLNAEPLRVREFVDSLITLFRPKAESKGVALIGEVKPDVPIAVMGDAQRLRQVLLNLIGNALKFTEQGEVRLCVQAKDDRLVVEVSDTGIGIASDQLPLLFDPFVQADSSATRKHGGTGLGLAIVRRFVEAMGGQVEVESELGIGSCFRLKLPLQAAESVPVEESQPERPKLREGLHVLLAEDNPVNQMVFQRMLARLGCEVELARDGREALEMLKHCTVDLVLMDCQMPHMDGLSATQVIRSWGGDYAGLPVIAITASAMEQDRQRCFAAGMSDFLSKPLSLDSLEQKLVFWTKNSA